jgi:hypothetical protein
MAVPSRLRLIARVAVFMLAMGLALAAAIFGVPTYRWWMQFQCWRAGPDSVDCWLLDLLEHPDKPRDGPTKSARPIALDEVIAA